MKRISLLVLLSAIVVIANAQVKQVKVNGSNFTVYQKGFESRTTNTPAIIMENGMGESLGHWDAIIDELAKVAPVFAYDRAGVGKSDKIFQMPTMKFVAENLKAILTTLKIPPPYILVGHSMGGLYIRGYAGFYPNEVAGLVFIDPADFTETKAQWKILLTTIGVPSAKADEMIQERLYSPAQVDSLRFGPWSEREVLTGLRRTDFAEVNALPLPNVPICFLVGGKFEVPRDRWSKDYDHPRFFKVKTNMNIERWEEVIYSSSKGGSLIYLTNCGHYVHRDDPKAVVANIKLLVESLQRKN
jgi:pimeloyl-ACP methyl ester carboxylesterase